MVRYFYAWIPAGGLSAVLLLVVPFLGPIVALILVAGAVAALGALVWRIVVALEAFGRFVLRRRPRDVGKLTVQAHTAPTLEYHQPA